MAMTAATGSSSPVTYTNNKIFSGSSFFRDRFRARHFNRPTPVSIPSLGLLVKYGADVTTREAETQVWLRDRLRGQVPIPEVFGWAEDGEQRFIYMQLVEGDTLIARMPSMSESELQSVCRQLKIMANTWRALPSDGKCEYIGSLGNRPLGDMYLRDSPHLQGPFTGPGALKHFHDACRIEMDSDISIVFTHDDLAPSNILLSPGPNPTIAAVIDWGQSGWHPSYWESCKARRVGLPPKRLDPALQEKWRTEYIPTVVDSEDD